MHASGVHHACFFFDSRGERLYASLYTPPAGRPVRLGVLLCQSWGMDGRYWIEWINRVAHDLAVHGAAAVVPHWPGTLDSEGDPHAASWDRLVEAGIDTVQAVADRTAVPGWGVLGVRIGAPAAVLLTPALQASHLVLVQPDLDPAHYFERLERGARRGTFMGPSGPPGWAYSHPNPPGLRDPAGAGRVQAALDAFAGEGAVVRYRRPKDGVTLPGFRTVTTWGDSRRPPRVDQSPLRLAAVRWMRAALRDLR